MARIEKPNCDIAMFGALGDLARRKLFPALYQLERAGLLGDETRLLALGLEDLELSEFCQQLRQGLDKHLKSTTVDESILQRLVSRMDYLALDFTSVEKYPAIQAWRVIRDHPLIVYMEIGRASCREAVQVTMGE